MSIGVHSVAIESITVETVYTPTGGGGFLAAWFVSRGCVIGRGF